MRAALRDLLVAYVAQELDTAPLISRHRENFTPAVPNLLLKDRKLAHLKTTSFLHTLSD